MPVKMVSEKRAAVTLVMTMAMTTMTHGDASDGDHHDGQDGALANG